jgi:hypothetical protein
MSRRDREDYIAGYDDGKRVGYDEGYHFGTEDGWQEAEEYFGVSGQKGTFNTVLKERNAAWNYLREREIHIVNEEYCWCGPTRHFVEPAA